MTMSVTTLYIAPPLVVALFLVKLFPFNMKLEEPDVVKLTAPPLVAELFIKILLFKFKIITVP